MMQSRNDCGVCSVFAILVVLASLPGCSGEDPLKQDFESAVTSNDLPEGWTLETGVGRYRAAIVSAGSQGQRAFAIGGSGGDAKLYGPKVSAAAGEILLAKVLAKSEPGNEGAIAIGFDVNVPLEQAPFSLQHIDTESQDWKEYWCATTPDPTGAIEANFFVNIDGSSSLVMDEVHVTHHKVVPDLLMENGGFEQAKNGLLVPIWNAYHDDGHSAQVLQYEKRPKEGAYCLRLLGEGPWAVAVQSHPMPANHQHVMLSGYARAYVGRALIKVEFHRGNELLAEFRSAEVDTHEWTRIQVVGDSGELEGVDSYRVVLAGEATGTLGGTRVDFDDLQMVITQN